MRSRNGTSECVSEARGFFEAHTIGAFELSTATIAADGDSDADAGTANSIATTKELKTDRIGHLAISEAFGVFWSTPWAITASLNVVAAVRPSTGSG
jgi:hypothetical protein